MTSNIHGRLNQWLGSPNEAVWLGILVLLAWILTPYTFGFEGDHLLYVTYSTHLLDPALWPTDHLFVNNQQMNAEWVSRGIAGLSRVLSSVEFTYYLYFLAVVAGRAVIVYLFVGLFLPRRLKSSAADWTFIRRGITLIILLLTIGGFPLLHKDVLFRDLLFDDLTPASLAVVLVLGGLYLYMTKRYLAGIILVGLAAYANPTYAIPLVPIVWACSLFFHRSLRTAVITGGAAALLLAPFVISRLLADIDNSILITSDFKDALRLSGEGSRMINSGVRLAGKHAVEGLVGLALLLVSASLTLERTSETQRRLVVLYSLAALALVVVGLIMEFLPLRVVVESRLPRMLVPVGMVVGFAVLTRVLAISRPALGILVIGGLGTIWVIAAKPLADTVAREYLDTTAVIGWAGLLLLFVMAALASGRGRLAAGSNTGIWIVAAATFVSVIGGMLALGIYDRNLAEARPGLYGLVIATWLVLCIASLDNQRWRQWALPAKWALAIVGTVSMLVFFSPPMEDVMFSLSQRFGGVHSPERFSEIWIAAFRLSLVVSLLLVATMLFMQAARRWRHPSLSFLALPVALPTVAVLIASYSIFPAYPMHKWVSENTPKEAVFLVTADFEHISFRVGALRSPFLLDEDNAPVLFDNRYLAEFNRRKALYDGWERQTGEELAQLIRETKVDYVLSLREIDAPNIERVHSTDGEFLYRVIAP